MNNITINRYDEATALLTGPWQRITGSQLRQARRNREVHYISNRRKADGAEKFLRRLQRLPLLTLGRMNRRANNAMRLLRQAIVKSPASAAPLLQSRIEAF